MRRRTWFLIITIAVVGALVWMFARRSAPPEIPFVRVTRETVVSTLSTNGKVEPVEWASARAERPGVVEKVYVQKGQQVKQNDALVSLDVGDAASQVAAANAQIAQAEAQQRIFNQGGRSTDLAEINSGLEKAKLDLQVAQRDYDSLQRLFEHQAATRLELEGARQRVEAAKLQIQSLGNRRSALVAPTDSNVAGARIREAQSAAAFARRNLALGIIRAPIAGTVYEFDLRRGAFLDTGGLVGNIGRLDQVRVVVYVDEPDLGRVQVGMPVKITWTGLPARQWAGTVQKLPTQVVPLGTRQVGEVVCVIANPNRDLLPGTNVDVAIQSRVVKNALTIPKECLRREGSDEGVFVLTGDHIAWRKVRLGVTSLVRAQILDGLAENDSIALPTDKPIRNGSRVQPVYPGAAETE